MLRSTMPSALNSGYAYRERILVGRESVLAQLVRCHPHSTHEEWRLRIERGEVEVDGRRAEPDTLLRAGQWLQWNRPPWQEPEAPADFEALYDDDWLVAVVKPRGLPTMPGGGFLEQTLLAKVRKRFPEASPMHRLGRETSGIVLFARTHAAGSVLQAAWRAHEVQKTYRALGSGVAAQDSFAITTPIGPVPHPVLGTLHAASAQGKASLSHARVLERREASTLFEVEIQTGRPHQIRIHLASIGHPLVGDRLYVTGGDPNPDGAARPGDPGYFLHAERLRFVHPATGAAMNLWAEPPAELKLGSCSLPDASPEDRCRPTTR